MATVIHQQADSESIAASNTTYPVLLGNYSLFRSANEAGANTVWRSAGVLSNLYINILTNDRAASTFRTRKGTANANLVVSITGSTTGKFEDTSNTDTVAAGDNWHASIVTGAGGTVFTYNVNSVLFAATTNTVHKIGCGFTDISLASTTEFSPFYGRSVTPQAADSNVGMTMRTAGTLAKLGAQVGVNSRTTTSTFRSRVNNGFGAQTISIAGGTTGNVEDTTNSDTIASGDLINWSMTTGTGTEILSTNSTHVEFTTTNSLQQYVVGIAVGLAQAAGVTTYYPFAGRLLTSTTESNMVAETNLAFTASLLQCNISANTIVLDSTLTLRKNSGVANQTVTITALTTGIFQDTTNTDTIVASDTLDYEVVTPSTLTAITIRSISLLGDSTVASASVPISSSVFRRTFSGIGTGIGKRQVHGW